MDTIFTLGDIEDENINSRGIHLQITKKELEYATETNIISCRLHHVLKDKHTQTLPLLCTSYIP